MRYEFRVYLDDRAGPVRLAGTGPTAAGALHTLVTGLAARGVGVARLDTDDWVTLADIAGRTGYTREAVRLWARGRAGPGGFPAPLNPGRRTLFYSWAEVAPWLPRRVGAATGPTDLAAAGVALHLRRLLAGTADPRSVLALAAPACGCRRAG